MACNRRCLEYHHAKMAKDEKTVRCTPGGGEILPLSRSMRNQFNIRLVAALTGKRPIRSTAGIVPDTSIRIIRSRR
jgi:hypothetical protein